MICFIGFLSIGHISKKIEGDVNTASKVFYSGISMGCINIIVQIVIPDATAIGVGYVEIVSTLALACLLQVKYEHNPLSMARSDLKRLSRVYAVWQSVCTLCKVSFFRFRVFSFE